jgi:hypothetical protein
MFSDMFISSRELGGKMWNISSLRVLINSRINIRFICKKVGNFVTWCHIGPRKGFISSVIVMNTVLHSPLLGSVVFSFLHNEKFFICTKKESFSFEELNHDYKKKPYIP